MKRKFLWICILLSAVGCLDDKSNYDYRDINDFENWNSKGVSNIQNEYTLYLGESQLFEPRVHFSIDTLNPDATCAWYLGETKEMLKLSDTKDYTYTADKVGACNLVFTATDNKTGITFSKNIVVTVVPAWKNGWLVLSKSASGESELSIILSKKKTKIVVGEDGKEQSVDTVVYVGTDMNVTPNLGRRPRKLVENFHFSSYTDLEVEDEVMLLYDGGCIELDGNLLQPVGSVEEEFLDGLPANFDPQDAVLSWCGKWLLNSDNYVYSAVMSVATDLHSGRYLSEPAFNKKKVKELLPYMKGSGARYDCANFFLGIGEDNTFFGVRDDGNPGGYYNGNFSINADNYIGSLVELNDRVPDGGDFSFFKNIDGEYIFHAWAGQATRYDPLVYLSILNRSGNYYWSYYSINAENSNYRPGQKIELEEHQFGLLDAGVMADYQCATLLPWKNLLVVASGNKLYGFDYYSANKGNVQFVNAPTFNSEIVHMAVRDYVRDIHNAHIAIALKSGEVYVYEVAYDVEMKQAQLVELYHKEGFGEIVDLICKFGSGANPGAYNPY
ncbi:PKD-like family lipoprotein [Butyricimonas sp.]|uniref:PKD-like family lipoprotein n=1 Tax=Butyricimonas sp. TaxID=1969738 RepID=UPI0025C528AC|nr:PKD-like family lipoprotein [Butyricimonas sp.]